MARAASPAGSGYTARAAPAAYPERLDSAAGPRDDPMRRSLPATAPAALCLAGMLAAALLLAAGPAAATDVLDPLDDPLTPPSAGGAARVDRLLAKLATHRRLLVVGAHPDDEDTTLLAYVVRGLGGEAAYLSLSRGEGGQNLIGPELGVGLGLLRSRELLAARQIDGARQYFTRAYDFGYTRSIEETLERWPKEVLLEDTVRVIRRFRPQVVVAIFPPDERAGHGQHQASGIVAGEAYAAASDPDFLPIGEQGEDLALWPDAVPWRPEAFYRAAWWRPESATVTFPLGLLEPVSGRSIFQIAMASRSQHRCQDMGMLQPLGPFEGRLAWEAGGAGAGGDEVFAGVDTRLAALAAVLPASEYWVTRDEVEKELAVVEALAREARAASSPASPRAALPAAVEIHRRLVQIRGGFGKHVPLQITPPEVYAFLWLLQEKTDLAAELVAAAAGIGLDAVADRETLVPGEEARVETAVWDAAGTGFDSLEVRLGAPVGFRDEPVEPEERDGFAARFQGRGDAPAEGYHLRAFRVTVPADAEPTVPYFLERPLGGDLYDWSDTPGALQGEPFDGPPLSAVFTLRVAGERIRLWREVVHRYRDQAAGEVRRPLRVVPALEVAAGRDLLVWPVAEAAPRELEVVVTSHAGRALSGRVEARVPAGWPQPAPAAFELPAAGARGSVRLTLTPPSPFPPGGYEIKVAAVVTGDVPSRADATGGGASGEAVAGDAGTDGGGVDEGYAHAAAERRYDLAVPLVDYPHIRPTPLPERAAVRLVAADLVLPGLDRVGYVRGASDRVPEALAAVGVPLEILTPRELETGDLGRFDGIVIGSRAYETEPALAEANPRLLDYARRGGLVIVQYQQYQYSGGGYAPYPLEIARPHGRVTDETAPVTVLEPAHPAFTAPNRIGAADWEGWVQERGLYMPASWGEPFRPLLEMADPGGEPRRGGLLVAPVGEGTYVYTGLAFFRQLPAGVPGAYRLFANLLALPRRGEER